MDLTPFQIVMQNRTRTPTLEELASQVTALAFSLQGSGFREGSTADQIAANVTSITGKVPKNVQGVISARSLDSVFQISTNSPTLVIYTLQLSVSVVLSTPQTASVDLRVDFASPPAISLGTASLSSSQTAGLSVATSTTSQSQLVAWVPAGAYVHLVTGGSGAATLLTQTEVTFNA